MLCFKLMKRKLYSFTNDGDPDSNLTMREKRRLGISYTRLYEYSLIKDIFLFRRPTKSS